MCTLVRPCRLFFLYGGMPGSDCHTLMLMKVYSRMCAHLVFSHHDGLQCQHDEPHQLNASTE